MLKNFTTSNRWWDFLWGNGHTLETDPTRRGWRAALSRKGGSVLIVGRRGIRGCFSVMTFDRYDYEAMEFIRKLDVAIYDDLTPEEVAQQVNVGRAVADEYREVDSISGWILPFIQEMERVQVSS